MKRAASKFKKQYAKGGLFSPEGWMGTKGAQNSIIGAGSLIGGRAPEVDANSSLMDEQYMNDLKGVGNTRNTVSGIGDVAMATGNPFAMAGGLVLKGVSGLIGQGAEKEAKAGAERRKFNRDLEATNTQGAKNLNSLPKYEAPQYGRRGLKLRTSPPTGLKATMRFKTKFGKGTC